MENTASKMSLDTDMFIGYVESWIRGGGGIDALIDDSDDSDTDDTVRFLMEHGADPNKTNHAGLSPLFMAAARGNVDIVRYLVERGADIERCNNAGLTPVGAAAYLGEVEAMRYLIYAGADTRAVFEWTIEPHPHRHKQSVLRVLHEVADGIAVNEPGDDSPSNANDGSRNSDGGISGSQPTANDTSIVPPPRAILGGFDAHDAASGDGGDSDSTLEDQGELDGSPKTKSYARQERGRGRNRILGGRGQARDTTNRGSRRKNRDNSTARGHDASEIGDGAVSTDHNTSFKRQRLATTEK